MTENIEISIKYVFSVITLMERKDRVREAYREVNENEDHSIGHSKIKDDGRGK